MSSLLPPPWGTGGRNNSKKQDYLKRHLNDIEYRTMACNTREQAAEVERGIKRDRGHEYSFKT